MVSTKVYFEEKENKVEKCPTKEMEITTSRWESGVKGGQGKIKD